MIIMMNFRKEKIPQHETLVNLRPVNDFEKNLFLEYWNEKLVEEISSLREQLEKCDSIIKAGVSNTIKENESLRRRNNSLRKTNDELIIKLLKLRSYEKI